MKTNFSAFGWRRGPASLARMAVLAMWPLLGGAVACSSSSNGSGDAFAEFEGNWRADSTSTSHLTCTTFGLDTSLALWSGLVFAPGTSSDLVETSGPGRCQFAFDVTNKVATVPPTDPYTSKATTCSVIIDSGTDQTTGDLHDLIMDVTPTSWSFQLFMPVAGQPPTGRLTGTSLGDLTDLDTVTASAVADSTCQYNVTMDLTKIAR